MVVNGDRQHTLGLILTNDILVQPVLDLSRGQDIDIQTIHSLHPGTACAAARAAVCFRVLRLIREQIMHRPMHSLQMLTPGPMIIRSTSS